jgi:hypothetical protein
MLLTTKYPGTCGSCGASISAGSLANYQKLLGIYCPTCPTPKRKGKATGQRLYSPYRPAGYYASKADPRGLYTPEGRCVGRMACGHEDYPCCGC